MHCYGYQRLTKVDVYLNDTLVTPSSNTYPFRAYVDTVLSYGAEAKNTQLTSQLWYKDTAGHMDATTVDCGNTGLIERQRHIAESRIVEMMGRLHVDLFLQDRFLLNGVSVKIRLVRSKDAFSLMAGGENPDYKVQIVDLAATILGTPASEYGSLDVSGRRNLVDSVVGLNFLVNVVKTVKNGFTNFAFAKIHPARTIFPDAILDSIKPTIR